MGDRWEVFINEIRQQDMNSSHLFPDITKPELRKELQRTFQYYKQGKLAAGRRTDLECLVKLHAGICRDNPEDEGKRRRHNALIYRYMDGQNMSNQEIADRLGLCKCALNLNLIRMLDELMVMLAGVPFITAKGEGPGETVKAAIKNYGYLQICREADLKSVFPEALRPDVEKAREYTVNYLDRMDWCFLQYERYCQGSPVDGRRLRVLNYTLAGNVSPMHMARLMGQTHEYIYKIIRINHSRMADLFSI